MATNPIDKEGLELARTINAKLVAIRADIAALELAMESVGSGGSGAWDDITGKPAAITGTTASFTTALESKLAGIESGATGDQDLSGLLTSATAASTYQPQAGMSSYATNVALAAKKGMRVFADDAARLAATPEFIGQIGFLATTESYYFAPTLDVGDWVETFEMQVRTAIQLADPLDLTVDVTGTLPIANGGTGGTTAADARTALGLGALATVTPGTNVATALAIAADSTGGIFRQGQALSATTVTTSGDAFFGSPTFAYAANCAVFRTSSIRCEIRKASTDPSFATVSYTHLTLPTILLV